MPIPLYVPPVAWSRAPNPFDRAVTRQPLRILVDQPLMSGPVDGEGGFSGSPLVGGGSTGYPDAAVVLRSYLRQSAFEVLFVADGLEEEGAVVIGDRDPYGDDVVSVQVKTGTGVRHTGINYYGQALAEAAQMVARHRIDEADARAGVLLYRVGTELEADLVVTDRGWLLAAHRRPGDRDLVNVVSPEEALAVMGLYLRWHYQPVIIGGATLRWHPTSMRRSAAFVAMPAFERWNQAGRAWCDTNGDLTLELLDQTCLTRVSRAFKFRDNVFGLSATMAGHEPEDMLCELDSLLFTLVGALDVAARIVDHVLGLRSSGVYGWQQVRSGGWQSRLQSPAEALYEYTKDGSEMQRAFQVLRWLRNSVHNEALDLMVDGRAYVVTVPASTQESLRAFLRENHKGWTVDALGIGVQPPAGATAARWLPGTGRHSVIVRRKGAPKPADPLAGNLVLDVRRFINRLFPAVLTLLNGIMRLTPLNKVPGYTAALEEPTRVNLPWQFSDTTGHRLRMIYGITELDRPMRTGAA